LDVGGTIHMIIIHVPTQYIGDCSYKVAKTLND